ncbi:MAG: ligand-binding sensor domain-containing protein, partial [Cyclobacteriaceae bacterium]
LLKFMKLKAYAISFLFFILLSLFFTYGQKYEMEFEKLTEEDGLSSNQVKCIFKDSRGFMWFGTNNGLNRYDAYEFEVWKHVPGDSTGIPNNSITDIVEDKFNRIWIGTNDGLASYSFTSNLFTQYPGIIHNENNLKIGEIRELAIQDSILWIAHAKGLFMVNTRLKQFKPQYIKINNETAYSVTSIGVNKGAGEVWFGSFSKGLYKYSIEHEITSRIHLKEMMNDFAECLFFADNNTLLIGTNNSGLIEYSIPTKKTRIHSFYSFTGNKPDMIKDISKNKENEYWISQGHGLFICDSNFVVQRDLSRMNKNIKGRLPGIVNKIYNDRDNINWLALGYSGINIYKENSKPINKYFYSLGNSDNNLSFVRSITVDSTGIKWVGTFGNGLMLLDKENNYFGHYTSRNSPLPSNIIYDTEIVNNHEYWIATSNGLIVFDPVKKKWGKKYTIEDNLWHDEIKNLLWDKEVLWIATREGLNKYLYKEDAIIKINVDNGIVHNKIMDIKKDWDGNIWFATQHGVSQFNKAKDEFINYYESPHQKTGLSDNFVLSIHVDSAKFVWIGTKNGLNRLDVKNNSFNWYFEKDGLINNIINKIAVDQQQNLYLLTPSGLMVTNRSLNQFRVFNKFDGLDNSVNVLTIIDNNKVIIGGAKTGFYAFNKDSIHEYQNPPPVYITRVGSLSGKKTHDRRKTTFFKYAERNIKIEYTVLDYFSPEKNRFAYKLEGFQDQWYNTSSEKREVVFYNLPPGEYVFRLTASNGYNIWNNQGAEHKIVISPPWWQAWWMILFYILFLSSIAVLTSVLRRKRNKLLENIDKPGKKLELVRKRQN